MATMVDLFETFEQIHPSIPEKPPGMVGRSISHLRNRKRKVSMHVCHWLQEMDYYKETDALSDRRNRTMVLNLDSQIKRSD